MDQETVAAYVAIWVSLTAKCIALYLAARVLSLTIFRGSSAWRSRLWVMAIAGIAVLSVLEPAAGAAPWLRDRVPDVGIARVTILAQAYVVAVAILLGLLIHALVRLWLVRHHSPRLHLELGLGEETHGGLGPALGMLRIVDIRRNDTLRVPTSFGVFVPVILVPTIVEGTVYRQFMRYAVLHEFVAVLRFDALWSLVARVIQCGHFLNPAVWWAFDHHRRAAEEVRDDWTAYASRAADEYAAELQAVARIAARRSLMSPDTPMVSTGSRHARARLARLTAIDGDRPRAMPRWQLPLAISVWLSVLAFLGSVYVAATDSGECGLQLRVDGFLIGVLVAAVTGGLTLVAGRRGPRRGRHEPRADFGTYRRTLAHWVRRIESDWQGLRWLLSRSGRFTEVGLFLVLLLVAMMMGALIAIPFQPDARELRTMVSTNHNASTDAYAGRLTMSPEEAFAILGLPADAGPLQVKSTYRRLAFVHHPDRNPECIESLDLFQQVSKAFQTLEAKFRIDAEANPPDILSGECPDCRAYALLREGLDGNRYCTDCLVSAEGTVRGLPGPIAVVASCGFAIVSLVVAATCLGMCVATDSTRYGVAALILSGLAMASLVWTCMTAVHRARPTGRHGRR